ncbi:MAG: hypothetical protein WKG00_24935 [Polyangiaceae bacterium]
MDARQRPRRGVARGEHLPEQHERAAVVSAADHLGEAVGGDVHVADAQAALLRARLERGHAFLDESREDIERDAQTDPVRQGVGIGRQLEVEGRVLARASGHSQVWGG